MAKLKLKRELHEVECDVCGCKFKQIRWWQAYCSTSCRVRAWAFRGQKCVNGSQEAAAMRDELNRLRAILNDAGIPY